MKTLEANTEMAPIKPNSYTGCYCVYTGQKLKEIDPTNNTRNLKDCTYLPNVGGYVINEFIETYGLEKLNDKRLAYWCTVHKLSIEEAELKTEEDYKIQLLLERKIREQENLNKLTNKMYDLSRNITLKINDLDEIESQLTELGHF